MLDLDIIYIYMYLLDICMCKIIIDNKFQCYREMSGQECSHMQPTSPEIRGGKK